MQGPATSDGSCSRTTWRLPTTGKSAATRSFGALQIVKARARPAMCADCAAAGKTASCGIPSSDWMAIGHNRVRTRTAALRRSGCGQIRGRERAAVGRAGRRARTKTVWVRSGFVWRGPQEPWPLPAAQPPPHRRCRWYSTCRHTTGAHCREGGQRRPATTPGQRHVPPVHSAPSASWRPPGPAAPRQTRAAPVRR